MKAKRGEHCPHQVSPRNGWCLQCVEELWRESDRVRDEVSDLRGFIDGLKPHIHEAAAMYGLAKR